jgi:hypothetical protein
MTVAINWNDVLLETWTILMQKNAAPEPSCPDKEVLSEKVYWANMVRLRWPQKDRGRKWYRKSF